MFERKLSFKPSAGPTPEEYTRPDLPRLACLEELIVKSPYLTDLAAYNRLEALTFAYYRQCVDRAVSNNPRVAYYPGIGGGSEPLDPISAFCALGVDEVIGVDIQVCRNPDWNPIGYRVDKALEKIAKQDEYKIEILSANDTSGEFIFDGTKRRITYYKGDAEVFMPSGDFKVIYQRRDTYLVTNLPSEVVDRAKLIYCLDDNDYLPERVADFALTHGFSVIDLGFVYKTLSGNEGQSSFAWHGNPQLAIR